MFRLGYNTNGLAHHRVLDALELAAELGYEGLAITPDVGELDVYHLRPQFVSQVRRAAEDLGLAIAIETGARYVLDPRRKHRPTLLEDGAEERARRVDFLRRSIDLARDLGGDVVSLWSGASPSGETGDAVTGQTTPTLERTFDHLCAGLEAVLDHAQRTGVRVAFEPEPGMFLERPSGYAELVRRLGSRGDALGLCLDVGHCVVTRDLPVSAVIERWSARLVHVHLDDSVPGVHEHVMFGRGELDLAQVITSLVRVGYAGMAAVELSRDSHRGALAAAEAMQHLRRAILHTT